MGKAFWRAVTGSGSSKKRIYGKGVLLAGDFWRNGKM
jgi:hypothetical protein